jgi:hypothetical protein
VPFFLILLKACFLWSCRYGEFEGIFASHYLLSQKLDPKERQVINLDQDVHVCGYFWWMVYELLFMNHLSQFSFSLDIGYFLSFFSLLLSFFFLLCFLEHVFLFLFA